MKNRTAHIKPATRNAILDQLAIAADGIIRRDTERDEVSAILRGDMDHILCPPKPPLWQRIKRWFR